MLQTKNWVQLIIGRLEEKWKEVWKKLPEYKVGDKVKIKLFQRQKLDPYYIGPYTIKEIAWNTVKLQRR